MATSGSPSSQSASLIHPTSMNSCPNSSQSSAISSIMIQNIGYLVSIKLTTTNYLTWSALFAPIFSWYNLTGIIDGTMPAPPKFLLDSFGNCTATLNPQYIVWFENDQNILHSWMLLFHTLLVSIRLMNYGRNWNHDWQPHIHELRSHLRTITKGDFTIAIYLQQIEEIADALANAGAPIKDSELISVILHGLPFEYESFIDAIQFRLGSTTIDELHGLLLSKELHLTTHKKVSSPAPIQAFNFSIGLLPTPTGDFGSHAFFTQSGSNLNSYGASYRGHSSNPRPYNTRGTQRNHQGSQCTHSSWFLF
ncbi:hypothetical protein ACFX2B_041305 [Malus domestica]